MTHAAFIAHAQSTMMIAQRASERRDIAWEKSPESWSPCGWKSHAQSIRTEWHRPLFYRLL